jgi:hypothetical protein
MIASQMQAYYLNGMKNKQQQPKGHVKQWGKNVGEQLHHHEKFNGQKNKKMVR